MLRPFRRACLALAVVGLAAACGNSAKTQTPAAQAISGVLALSGAFAMSENCAGTDGFDDITEGAQVVLTDDTGRVVGTTTLGAGDPVKPLTIPSVGSECDFRFGFPAMPLTAKFYAVEVAHRGKVTASVAALNSDGWTFHLTLGT